MNEGFQRVASLKDIPDGGLASATLPGGKEICLARAADQVFAMDIMCTHQEAWLDSGFFHAATLEVECPLHEGRFDARTGQPTCLPPTEPVVTYQVAIEGGEVLVGPPKA